MKKIPCLFVRDFTDKRNPILTREVTPGCEWVLAGEGTASRKWDGTACAVISGILYKRYDAKRGKAAPEGAIPCSEPDPVTGHHPHWLKVGDEPESKWHRAAWHRLTQPLEDGTYELCGPHFSANPERVLGDDAFFRHGLDVRNPPRDFDGLGSFLASEEIEGLVFAHEDGRMCKIRRDDYGLPWPVKS